MITEKRAETRPMQKHLKIKLRGSRPSPDLIGEGPSPTPRGGRWRGGDLSQGPVVPGYVHPSFGQKEGSTKIFSAPTAASNCSRRSFLT